MNKRLKTTVMILGAIIIVMLLILILVPSGVLKKNNGLNVVTTFFPLYDFTRNVGGDRINLEILFTQTPAVSSFKPSDIQKINKAGILIKNGAGLEPVLDELVEASENPNLIVIDTSKNIELLDSTQGQGHNKAGSTHSADPHIWLDPQNAIEQVITIRDALMRYDPKNAEYYDKNAHNYILKLQELDERIKIASENFKQKEIITFHPAFQYFAKRYGLHQAAVFQEIPGKEPSPSDLASILETAKKLKVRALFAEPQFSPKIVKSLANDLGIEVRTLNPIESGDTEKDSYISLMKKNLEELKAVLQ